MADSDIDQSDNAKANPESRNPSGSGLNSNLEAAGPRRSGVDQAAYEAGRGLGQGKSFIDKSFANLQDRSSKAMEGDKNKTPEDKDAKEGPPGTKSGIAGSLGALAGKGEADSEKGGGKVEKGFDKLADSALGASSKTDPLQGAAQEASRKLHLTNLAALLTVVFWSIIGWSLFFQGLGILFLPIALLAINFPLISAKYAYKTALLLVSLIPGAQATYKFGHYVDPNDVKLKGYQKILIVFFDMIMIVMSFIIVFSIIAGVCYVSLKGSVLTQAGLYATSKSAYQFCQSIISGSSGGGDFGGGGAGGSFGGSTAGNAIAIIPWSGQDPPGLDWSNTKSELKAAWDQLKSTWNGEAINATAAYRPQAYQDHNRSVWDAWRLVQGQSVKGGYNCSSQYDVSPPANWKDYANDQTFMSQLTLEVNRHGSTGDTRPACERSDHTIGIAVDIQGKKTPAFLAAARAVGLCRNISTDEPHFVLIKYLPTGQKCVDFP